jgi:hypothetical protein
VWGDAGVRRRGSASKSTRSVAEEAYAAGNGVIAVLPGVVLSGAKSLVEAALAPGAEPAALPEQLALKGEQQLAFRFDAVSGNATLARLVESIEIERRGRTFQVQLELRGTPTEQARDLGTVAALGAALIGDRAGFGLGSG